MADDMIDAAVECDPYALEIQRDPYPSYQQLRAHSPVHHVAKHDFWVLARCDHATAAASDFAMTSTLGLSQLDPFPAEGELPPYAHSIATMDPPDHTQLRRMVQSIFGTKHLRAWVPRIEPIAERLVTEVLDAGDDADIARQLAVPLPADVITELTGLPATDRDQLVRWSDEVTAICLAWARSAWTPRSGAVRPGRSWLPTPPRSSSTTAGVDRARTT